MQQIIKAAEEKIGIMNQQISSKGSIVRSLKSQLNEEESTYNQMVREKDRLEEELSELRKQSK